MSGFIIPPAYRLLGSWSYATNVMKVDFNNLSASIIAVYGRGFTTDASVTIDVVVSTDNGVTFYTTNGNYVTVNGNGVESNAIRLLTHSTAATTARDVVGTLYNLNVEGVPKMGVNLTLTTLFTASSLPINAIRFRTSNGTANITGGNIALVGF